MNEKLTLVKTRLWDLAMGFVLDDIVEEVKKVISEIRHKEKKNE